MSPAATQFLMRSPEGGTKLTWECSNQRVSGALESDLGAIRLSVAGPAFLNGLRAASSTEADIAQTPVLEIGVDYGARRNPMSVIVSGVSTTIRLGSRWMGSPATGDARKVGAMTLVIPHDGSPSFRLSDAKGTPRIELGFDISREEAGSRPLRSAMTIVLRDEDGSVIERIPKLK